MTFAAWARETAAGAVCYHSIKRRSCARCLHDALAQANEGIADLDVERPADEPEKPRALHVLAREAG